MAVLVRAGRGSISFLLVGGSSAGTKRSAACVLTRPRLSPGSRRPHLPKSRRIRSDDTQAALPGADLWDHELSGDTVAYTGPTFDGSRESVPRPAERRAAEETTAGLDETGLRDLADQLVRYALPTGLPTSRRSTSS